MRSSSGTPRAFSVRLTSPMGVSQMPMTRSPSTERIAWVMIPAGFVKLMSQAFGHWRFAARASSSAGPSERNA